MEEGTNKSRIAKHLDVSLRTIIRWSQAIDRHDSLEAFLEYYQKAKKSDHQNRKIDPILKRRICALRKKHYQCCGQKIQYFLQKEYGMQVSVTTIYKILSEKYQLRSKWQKNQKRGPVPAALAPREMLQMDTVLFGEVFAFTAIDIYTRESNVLLRSALEAMDGKAFLDHCLPRCFDGFSAIIQTDGGSEFKREFSASVHDYCAHHCIARPYKKMIINGPAPLTRVLMCWPQIGCMSHQRLSTKPACGVLISKSDDT